MAAEPVGRKAPYAPIVALREFFERMRDMSAPQRVDRRFIQKMNVASNNEWALLSALKFLGVVDERGVPTHSYRLLQTTDRFQETLAHLVRKAYADLFATGADRRGTDELRDYFTLTSSPSQARNAARFFREVCDLAGIEGGGKIRSEQAGNASLPAAESDSSRPTQQLNVRSVTRDAAGVVDITAAKIRLIDKLPEAHPDWSAAEYSEICRHFAEMMRSLGAEA